MDARVFGWGVGGGGGPRWCYCFEHHSSTLTHGTGAPADARITSRGTRGGGQPGRKQLSAGAGASMCQQCHLPSLTAQLSARHAPCPLWPTLPLPEAGSSALPAPARCSRPGARRACSAPRSSAPSPASWKRWPGRCGSHQPFWPSAPAPAGSRRAQGRSAAPNALMAKWSRRRAAALSAARMCARNTTPPQYKPAGGHTLCLLGPTRAHHAHADRRLHCLPSPAGQHQPCQLLLQPQGVPHAQSAGPEGCDGHL